VSEELVRAKRSNRSNGQQVGLSKSLKTGAGDRVRTGDVQLGKTTVNWKQRTLRFQHLVLAIENTPVFTMCSAQLANGAQMEHTKLGPV